MGSLEKHLSKFSDKNRFRGKYLFELHELQDIEESPEENNGKVLRIDEIDGTTNTKRTKASLLGHNPRAAVSIALCEDESMGSIIVGVVYDMHNKNTFSGLRIDGSYMAFCDRVLLDPEGFKEKKGDSSTRIMVVGYSNRERMKKAEIEQAILDADKTKKDFRIYGGSRSSTIDILNILRNQYDAYIDPRALWPGSGAMLYPYDVAGVIPIAYGCGLEISDVFGKPIEMHNGKNEPLSLIVARKGLKDRFMETLAPIVTQSENIYNPPSPVLKCLQE
jgi:fructose-1,6-bisphosphatase/inositol monophosphatase family enzyme